MVRGLSPVSKQVLKFITDKSSENAEDGFRVYFDEVLEFYCKLMEKRRSRVYRDKVVCDKADLIKLLHTLEEQGYLFSGLSSENGVVAERWYVSWRSLIKRYLEESMKILAEELESFTLRRIIDPSQGEILSLYYSVVLRILDGILTLIYTFLPKKLENPAKVPNLIQKILLRDALKIIKETYGDYYVMILKTILKSNKEIVEALKGLRIDPKSPLIGKISKLQEGIEEFLLLLKGRQRSGEFTWSKRDIDKIKIILDKTGSPFKLSNIVDIEIQKMCTKKVNKYGGVLCLSKQALTYCDHRSKKDITITPKRLNRTSILKLVKRLRKLIYYAFYNEPDLFELALIDKAKASNTKIFPLITIKEFQDLLEKIIDKSKRSNTPLTIGILYQGKKPLKPNLWECKEDKLAKILIRLNYTGKAKTLFITSEEILKKLVENKGRPLKELPLNITKRLEKVSNDPDTPLLLILHKPEAMPISQQYRLVRKINLKLKEHNSTTSVILLISRDPFGFTHSVMKTDMRYVVNTKS